jgi:hypothetical protein
MADAKKSSVLSRFAHFAGLRADDNAPETDVTKVDDKVDDLADDQDDTKDDVKDVQDRLDACESRLDALEKADDDDNDGEEMDDDDDKSSDDKKTEASKKRSRFQAGRIAERARAAAIFADPAASANPVLASELAFNSGISAAKAISLLKASLTASPATKASLASRMTEVKDIKIKSEAAGSADKTGLTPAQRLRAAAEKLGK